jgi:hypothetical protein
MGVQSAAVGRLPEVGLGVSTAGPALTRRQLERLALLRPAHLRVDSDLAHVHVVDHFRAAAAPATILGVPLEVALTLSDRVDEELADFVRAVGEVRPRVCRWLIFHEEEWSTTARWVRLARQALAAFDPAVPLYSGTRANFRELNGGRPPTELLEGITFAAHPQEHAFDNASLVETCGALPDTVHTARQFAGALPVAVTPITLRKRFNPYATGPAAPVPPGRLPPRVDPRQMSLFGAGWTLGSLKYLAEAGAASVTYYETVGWLGVMEAEAGCPLPGLFPSEPDTVFPLFHVLADANEFAGAEVLKVEAALPLICDGLALRSAAGTRVLLANLTGAAVPIRVTGLAATARVHALDETTFAEATRAPEAFRRSAGEALPTPGGRLELTLRPYAYARLDIAR